MNLVPNKDYITRNGTRVTIHNITEGSSFSVKGSVWRMFRGKYVPRIFAVWKPCGQYLAVGTSPLDIVGEWTAQAGTLIRIK